MIKFRTAILIAFAALLAGCGSSSSGDSSEPISKTAFLKQGNGICEQAVKQREEDLKAATEDSDGSGGSEGMAHLVDTALESIENMADELAELDPPAAQKKEAEALVKELEKEIEAVQADPDDPINASSFKVANATAHEARLYACQI
jgi:ABC-type Zn uptake system ZnuABC Zn-binding protein ZnuA